MSNQLLLNVNVAKQEPALVIAEEEVEDVELEYESDREDFCKQENEVQLPVGEVFEEVEYLEPEILEEQNEVISTSSLTDLNIPRCLHCAASFQNETSLRIHLWTQHCEGVVNPLVCSICSYSFEHSKLRLDVISNNILMHLAAHEAENISCPKVFKSEPVEDHELRQQIKPHSQNKCRGCEGTFLTYTLLREHLISTPACKDMHEKPFKCFICEETFTMGISKKKHIQTVHQDKAGADCPLCVRCRIPSAVAFENHYKTHFASEWNDILIEIRFYLKFHILEPRFCCNYCTRTFYESDRLQTHIRRSHERSKFFCNWCAKTFVDKSGIARHILGVHFNQRNHKCNVCKKAFTASYNLKEHLFSVHKQASNFYTCEVCAQDFLYRKPFERHRAFCSGSHEKRKRWNLLAYKRLK